MRIRWNFVFLIACFATALQPQAAPCADGAAAQGPGPAASLGPGSAATGTIHVARTATGHAAQPQAPATGPNLTFYQYSGWAAPLVPRPVNDATPNSVPAPGALGGDACSTYWNVFGINDGDSYTNSFDVDLYLDGWWTDGLSVGQVPPFYGFYGINSGPVCSRGGRHTVEVLLDPNDVVYESDEFDNAWAHQWIFQPVIMQWGTPVTRTAPPDLYGGTASIVDGSPIYPNRDGLRYTPVSWWTALPMHALNSADDYDLRLFTPSPSASNGFAGYSAQSSLPAGDLDFIVVNGNTMAWGNWDVGVQNYSGGISDYRLTQVPNEEFALGSTSTGSLAQDQMLRLWEISAGSAQLPRVQLTLTVLTPNGGPLHVGWLDKSFGLGGRDQLTAQAVTNGAGTVTLEVDASTPGYYSALVFRDPSASTAPVSFSLRVRQAPANYNAWALTADGYDFYLAAVDPHLGLLSPAGYIASNLTDPQLASNPLHDRLYVLSQPAGGVPASLLTVIPSTASVVANASLNAPYAQRYFGLAWNARDQRLYTVVRNYDGEATWYEFVTVDPNGGSQHLVGRLPALVFGPFDFSPTGYADLLFGDTFYDRLDVQKLDPISLTLVSRGLISPLSPYSWPEAAYLGDQLWALKQSGTDVFTVRLNAQGQPVEQVGFPGSGLTGLSPRTCVDATPSLTVSDVDHDAGGQILVDWTAFAPVGGTIKYDILRATDACALLDPDLAVVGSVVAGGLRRFTDTSAVNYISYYYAVRVVGPAGVLITTLYAGPVASHPDLLINEFSTSALPKHSAQQGAARGSPAPGGATPERVGEMVEIRNRASTPLDLTGFRLSNGPGSPTPDEEPLSGTIPAGGLFVHTLSIIDLPTAGGSLALLTPAGSSFTFDIVPYGSQGGAPAVPAGFTITRVEGTTSSDATASSFETWTNSFGNTNNVPTPDLGHSMVVNEVFSASNSGGDYVELYNPLGSAVVLNQFALSDGVNFLTILSSGLSLQPGQYLTMQQSAAGSFTQNLTGDLLYLYKLTTDGHYQRVDQLGWGGGPTASTPNDALCRIPDGLAVYLGSGGANWVESGGGVTLNYGPHTPGLPNRDLSVTQVVVDKGGGGNFTTIGAALASVAGNARILVNPGTYAESITLKNDVEVHGAGADPSLVVITGAGGGAIVTATSLNASAVLAGVTLKNGNAAQGAALLITNSSPTVRNVRFEQNRATTRGGAVAVLGGNPTFTGCFFNKNICTGDGGAVAVTSGAPSITTSLFVLNQAGARGGAVFVGGGTTTLESCVLDRNSVLVTGSGIVHGAGGSASLSFCAITNDLHGAPLRIEGGGATGRITFNCGGLFGHPEPFNMAAGGIDTASVSLANPLFCQPLMLNYAYPEGSPLAVLAAHCDRNIGVAGPPCALTATGTPTPATPLVTRLLAPAPNPFNPATTLRFELATPGTAALTIFDLRGRRVAELLGGDRLDSGAHAVVWKGQDAHGRSVASGVYLAQLAVDGHEAGEPQRLVLLK